MEAILSVLPAFFIGNTMLFRFLILGFLFGMFYKFLYRR